MEQSQLSLAPARLLRPALAKHHVLLARNGLTNGHASTRPQPVRFGGLDSTVLPTARFFVEGAAHQPTLGECWGGCFRLSE